MRIGMAMTQIRQTDVHVVVIEDLWGGRVQGMGGCGGGIAVLHGEARVGYSDGRRGMQGRGISGVRSRGGSRRGRGDERVLVHIVVEGAGWARGVMVD
jgi:hypothetical protein